MQKLAEICIRRPVFAAMIILALVVVGTAGYFKLGVDRFPSVDLPTVSVRTTLTGASPEEMETLVSQPIEEAVNTVDGIEELRSVSGQGSSIVIATFGLNRDINAATQDVRDRVSAVVNQLPPNTLPPVVQKFDNDSTPVMTVALSSKERSIRELTELADKVIRPQLERASGVADVNIVGGLNRAINVWVDADKLANYQLSIMQVRDALVKQNADIPGGNVDAGRRELSLRTLGRYTSARAMNDLVVAQKNGIPVHISDIGRVEDGTKEQRSLARLNGVPTVTLEIRRQSGANTMATIAGAKKALDDIKAQLPADINTEIIRDQSRYINEALHEINLHLVLGSILACLVVLAFMRSWRSTIIAGVAIPASVISTFGMMRALNFTLNSVTMLALTLMVGIVIDDAIVVLENIFRFVEEKKMNAMEAARAATKDIGLAVLATTLSLVVIFLPVSFMSSISGRFLYQFGITAAVAIMVSLLVSFTLTPMMSARLLRGEVEKARESHGEAAASRSGFYSYIDRAYTWLLAFAMRHRLIVSTLAIIVIASSVPLYRAVKQEYTPSDVDEAEFDVNVTAPEGTSLASMNEAMRAIEKEIRETPGVRLILATAGGSFLGNVNTGSVYVRIAPHEERVFSLTKLWEKTKEGHPLEAFRGNYSQSDVMQEIRRRMKKFAPIRVAVRNAPSFNIGGGNFDIDFALRGPDLESLAKYTEQLREMTLQPNSPLQGIVDADTTLKLNKPELRVRIDRARAADLGVSTQDIADSLRILVGGDDRVSRFYDPSTSEDYDVGLRLDLPNRRDKANISRLFVPSSRGTLVRLDNLVNINEEFAPSRIDRLDRQRQASLRAGVAPGYALGDRIEALKKVFAEMNLPPTYNAKVAGRGRELERTFIEFIFAFLLSIAFMYMILASQFESVVHPFTILLSLPLCAPFALLSLYLTHDTLNLYSALGILVLFGVVKKNSILQIDHMNNLRAEGIERYDAIIQANRDRLRPILMTTLALVAGMLPLAIGTGPGAEERRSIATVVIGGQTLSLLLTLIVTPVAYSILDDLGATHRLQSLSTRTRTIFGGIKERLATAFARRRKESEDDANGADEKKGERVGVEVGSGD
jgi:HAE1 family hydrophobic/amphiphilic exporter-1